MTYKSKMFLEWAKHQRGVCCICKSSPGTDLHHFGQKGMGQKGSDLEVARICRDCHLGKNGIQGKRRIGMERISRLDMWCDLQEDSIKLLTGYVEYLEKRLK